MSDEGDNIENKEELSQDSRDDILKEAIENEENKEDLDPRDTVLENVPDESELNNAPLTKEMIKNGISSVQRTADGSGHAFVRLQVQDSGITNVDILNQYLHLRYVVRYP